MKKKKDSQLVNVKSMRHGHDHYRGVTDWKEENRFNYSPPEVDLFSRYSLKQRKTKRNTKTNDDSEE